MKQKYLYYASIFNFITSRFIEPWDFTESELHEECKNFIKSCFAGTYEGVKPYIDFLQDYIFNDCEPEKDDIIIVNKLVMLLTSICEKEG